MLNRILLVLLSSAVLIAAMPLSSEPVASAYVQRRVERTVHLYEPAPESPFLGDVTSALEQWTAGRQTADLQPWISAITDVCQSRLECLQLAAIPFEETGFVPWAVDQSCNDRQWRAEHQMQRVCDGGWAIGPFQIHDQMLLGASPEKQATEALEIMRRHPQAWTTWKRARALADSTAAR